MEPLLSALDDWDEDKFRERIRRIFKPEQSHIIIVGDREIGVIQIIETETDVNLAQIHLLEGYRGNGIGTTLVAELLARAARGNKTASLSAPRNNRAIALYERFGYRISKDDGGSIIDMLHPGPSAD